MLSKELSTYFASATGLVYSSKSRSKLFGMLDAMDLSWKRLQETLTEKWNLSKECTDSALIAAARFVLAKRPSLTFSLSSVGLFGKIHSRGIVFQV